MSLVKDGLYRSKHDHFTPGLVVQIAHGSDGIPLATVLFNPGNDKIIDIGYKEHLASTGSQSSFIESFEEICPE